MAEKKKTFEEQMARLEGIVKALEKGDAPLNESLLMFEEGTALIRSCEGLLDKAEQKVIQLKKGQDGEPAQTPFDAEEKSLK